MRFMGLYLNLVFIYAQNNGMLSAYLRQKNLKGQEHWDLYGGNIA